MKMMMIQKNIGNDFFLLCLQRMNYLKTKYQEVFEKCDDVLNKPIETFLNKKQIEYHEDDDPIIVFTQNMHLIEELPINQMKFLFYDLHYMRDKLLAVNAMHEAMYETKKIGINSKLNKHRNDVISKIESINKLWTFIVNAVF
jgi:hypothetical protein